MIDMKLPWQFWAVCVGVLTLALVVNYLFALAGEPRALWMWRDVLGVIS